MAEWKKSTPYPTDRFLLVCLASLVLCACGDSGPPDDPPPLPDIRVSVSRIDVAAGGGDVSVDVSNAGGQTLHWWASMPSSADWARLSEPSRGTDAGTLLIQVDSNEGAAREIVLTVTESRGTTSTVTIRQAQAPAVIELSTASTSLKGDGGTVTLRVRNVGFGSMEWSASLPNDAPWAHIERGSSGVNYGVIDVGYGVNGGDDRTLAVTVTAPSASNSPQSVALRQPWFGADACTWPTARQETIDILQKTYYFNDEREQQAKYDALVPEDYATIDGLLDELRFMPETYDRGFTFWLTRDQTNRLLNAQAHIFGLRWMLTGTDPTRIAVVDVYKGSPADMAGFERGDTIVGLNGKNVGAMLPEQVRREFGPNEADYEVTFEIEKRSGEHRTEVLAKRLVDVPTVPEEQVRVFDTAQGRVGYLHFRSFLGNAGERLLDEFAGFRSQGVRHLILDLRYNEGGSVPIAQGLATLAGGPELFTDRETVMAQRIHNRTVSWLDETMYFGCDVFGDYALYQRCMNEAALPDLENVVFITSRRSASASELVIIALQPYENVTLVGERSHGKPVGQYGCDFCVPPQEHPVFFRLCPEGLGEAVLWSVSFALANAEGFEDYYEGIAADCEVPDDLGQALGDPREGRIAAALEFIETGRCDQPAPVIDEPKAVRDVRATSPIQQYLGY